MAFPVIEAAGITERRPVYFGVRSDEDYNGER
jgi:hypothetical protein